MHILFDKNTKNPSIFLKNFMVISSAVINWGTEIFTYGRGFTHPHSIPGDFSLYTSINCLIKKFLFYSSTRIYVALTGPCTPTIRFISISALLLGPEIKLTQEATNSPFSIFS